MKMYSLIYLLNNNIIYKDIYLLFNTYNFMFDIREF